MNVDISLPADHLASAAALRDAIALITAAGSDDTDTVRSLVADLVDRSTLDDVRYRVVALASVAALFLERGAAWAVKSPEHELTRLAFEVDAVLSGSHAA